MEMVGLLAGQPVVQLSQLFLDWNQGGRGDGGTSWTAAQAAVIGVCAEHLWPFSLTYGPQQWLNGVSDYNQLRTIEYTPPDGVCFADAPNHKLVEFEGFNQYNNFGPTKEGVKRAVDAGYALTTFVRPNHTQVIFDYDDGGVLGLDSRSGSATPYHLDWDAVVGCVELVVKRVAFSGIVAPVRVNPFMPNNNPSLLTAMRNRLLALNQSDARSMADKLNAMQPPVLMADIAELFDLLYEIDAPQPWLSEMTIMVCSLVPADASVPNPSTGGNVPLLNDIISVAQSALAAGSITQAQIDQIRVNASLLAPVVSQPPATGDSPERTVITTSGPAIMLGGHAWTFGMSGLPGGMAILLDGISAGGGSALLMTNVSGKLWVRNLFNDWFRWDGGWVKTGQVAP
jgi:hypothetical protein